ncbi:uncharacterized protein MEPE_00058 [Melanopsichium pennsylvanicum]|uniref:Uncharacterized protein n=1 Tax=Melanopsichium pennsylvanicum TaxID=63383 RepID=A0AAJ4XHL8_9BASI|nr:uncharacterized protein MEPE_00058 [Melanopsichium pennsylvanicum]
MATMIQKMTSTNGAFQEAVLDEVISCIRTANQQSSMDETPVDKTTGDAALNAGKAARNSSGSSKGKGHEKCRRLRYWRCHYFSHLHLPKDSAGYFVNNRQPLHLLNSCDAKQYVQYASWILPRIVLFDTLLQPALFRDGKDGELMEQMSEVPYTLYRSGGVTGNWAQRVAQEVDIALNATGRTPKDFKALIEKAV